MQISCLMASALALAALLAGEVVADPPTQSAGLCTPSSPVCVGASCQSNNMSPLCSGGSCNSVTASDCQVYDPNCREQCLGSITYGSVKHYCIKVVNDGSNPNNALHVCREGPPDGTPPPTGVVGTCDPNNPKHVCCEQQGAYFVLREGNKKNVCRPACDKCDQTEYCDGTNPTCPEDTYQPAGFICQRDSDPSSCVEPWKCAGGSPSTLTSGQKVSHKCPSDWPAQIRPTRPNLPDYTVCQKPLSSTWLSTNECRKKPICKTGNCVIEFYSSGTPCGTLDRTNHCDLGSECSANTQYGSPDSVTCQAKKRATGTVCQKASGVCDNDWTCDAAGQCNRGPDATGRICSPRRYECDYSQYCAADNSACPDKTSSGLFGAISDGAQHICAPAFGVCDKEDVCTWENGVGVCRDNFAETTQVCRPARGLCDLPETCPGGTNRNCPKTDAKKGSDVVCLDTSFYSSVFGGAVGECEEPAKCDGASNLCFIPDFCTEARDLDYMRLMEEDVDQGHISVEGTLQNNSGTVTDTDPENTDGGEILAEKLLRAQHRREFSNSRHHHKAASAMRRRSRRSA